MAVGERDGRPVIVSGGADRTIRVWDLQTGEPVLDPLAGHDGEVYAVAVGERDGRPVIVSGGADRTIRVWDLQTGEPVLGPLAGHDGKVYAVAVGERDGRPVIVSGGADRTVRVWDLQTGEPVLDRSPAVVGGARGGGGAARCPAGHPAHRPRRGTRGGGGGAARPAGHRLRRRRPHDTGVGPPDRRARARPAHRPLRQHAWAVAIGEQLGRPVIVSGDGIGMVQAWDLQTGKRVLDPRDGGDNRVYAVAVGERGDIPVIASGGADGTVRLWNLDRATSSPARAPATTAVCTL